MAARLQKASDAMVPVADLGQVLYCSCVAAVPFLLCPTVGSVLAGGDGAETLVWKVIDPLIHLYPLLELRPG